jgi:hypothetical protein
MQSGPNARYRSRDNAVKAPKKDKVRKNRYRIVRGVENHVQEGEKRGTRVNYRFPASSWPGVGAAAGVASAGAALRMRPNQFPNVGPCVRLTVNLDLHVGAAPVCSVCVASPNAARSGRLGRPRRPKRSTRWLCCPAGLDTMMTRDREKGLAPRVVVQTACGDVGDRRMRAPSGCSDSPSERALGT